MPDVTIEGARCAVHPNSPATGTCARCGNFVCAIDTAGGPLCAACRSRSAPPFPFNRSNLTIGGLWEHSLAIAQREWAMFSVAALIIFGVNGAVSTMGQVAQGILTAMLGGFKRHGPSPAMIVSILIVTLVVVAVQIVAQGALTMGLFRMLFDAQDGRPLQINVLFSQLAKLPRYLVAMAVVMGVSLVVGAVVIGIPTAVIIFMRVREAGLILLPILLLLVVVPVTIYVVLPLQLLIPMIVEDESETGGMELLRRCYTLADGQRLNIFLVGLIGGLVMLGGLMACCVGMLPAFGLSQLLIAALYRALRNDNQV